MYRYLFFDLDGTLTDPREGITRCVQYALHSLGIEEPDPERLVPFIGPPLKDSFMEFYQVKEEDVPFAVKKYRERFEEKGMLENAVYPGVAGMLEALKKQGRILAVASSKPEPYVKKILEHFGILSYFNEVVGATMDAARTEKRQVIEEALHRLGIGPETYREVLMVGDRRHDVEGAGAFGIDTLGVRFGYAAEGELEEAGAAYLVDCVEEMAEFLLKC